MEQDKVRSPEGLDSYITIASPGTFVMLAALTLVFVSLIVWGFTGTLSMTASYQGYVYRSDYFTEEYAEDGGDTSGRCSVFCFVDPASYRGAWPADRHVMLHSPDQKYYAGTLVSTSTTPLSKQEIAEMFDSDWVADTFAPSEYCWVLRADTTADISQDLYKQYELFITIAEVTPIELLFG